MANLSDSDRFETTGEVMRKQNITFTLLSDITGLTKPELRAAINALDDYMNTNSLAINNSIPQPARGVLTAQQKAALLVYVIHKRFARGA